MEQPLPMTLEPNYFDSMDSITAHYFAHISDLKKKKKKDFSKNSVNLDMGI